MFKVVTRILGVIALTGWMGAANAALIFDFSWGSDDGKIIGEIYGLSDNVDGLRATGIVLTSIGGQQVNIDTINDPFWDVTINTFVVLNKSIVGFDFLAWNSYDTNTRTLNFNSGEGYVSFIHRDYLWNRETRYRSETFSFVNRVTVPEPSSVILMLLGLAGLSFARYRKQY
jgi:hypothetical protein